MSIFIPYSVEKVINHFVNLYSLDLTTLTDYERLMITLISNIYFFVFWFIIIYFSLKIFNRIYEKLF